MPDDDATEKTVVSRRSLLTSAAAGSLLLALGLDPPRAYAADPWTRPFTTYGRVSRHFNPSHPDYPSGHRGTDYHQNDRADDTIRSIGNGTVVYTGSAIASGELGCVVVIQHPTHWSLYAHLHDFPGTNRSPYLVGQQQSVLNGTKLGTKGNTGRSFGAHLHLEMGPGSWQGGMTRQSYANLINPDTILHNAPTAPPPGSNPQPPQEGFLMALSDFQQKQVYDALVAQSSGGAYYKPDALINIIRSEIAPAIAAIAAGNIKFPNAQYNAFDAIINEVRGANGAAATASRGSNDGGHAAALSENLGSLSDAELAHLASVIARESSRRSAI